MGRNSPQPKPSPLQFVPKSQSYIYLSLPPHLFLSFSLSISFAQIQPGDISCISSPPAHIARVHSVSAVACAESNYIFAVIEMPGKRRRPPPSSFSSGGSTNQFDFDYPLPFFPTLCVRLYVCVWSVRAHVCMYVSTASGSRFLSFSVKETFIGFERATAATGRPRFYSAREYPILS